MLLYWVDPSHLLILTCTCETSNPCSTCVPPTNAGEPPPGVL